MTDPSKFVVETRIPSDDDLDELLSAIRTAPNEASLQAIRDAGADNTASAQVNAGSLTSFTERLSGESKADVKNSTLFAQLASDFAHDRFKQPMDWYKKYIDVLGNIGWNQPAFAFDSYTSGGSTVKMDEAVLDILASIATGNELAMVAATMEGLRRLSDDSKQMRIWDAKSSNGAMGNFQIFPVDKLPNDDVVMVLTGMQFDAQNTEGRFLWWSWSSTSIKIERAANKFVLNEGVYARVRQAIVDKLGDKAVQFVADIPIA